MYQPLYAFGWMSLPMLGWLAAAAAPLLIHLWSRRKYRETSWAAMEYLLAAVRRQSRRLLLEQWLLLAVRTLAITLVVAAVAEPYFQRAGMAFSPGGHTHRVLVFDGSYSMAYRPADKTRFERAKELARQIVADSPQGDAFTLVLMSATPRVIVGTAALDGSAIAEEIDRLALPHDGADLPTAIPAIQKLIENVAAENPRLDQHEVFFLTDMHRRTWAPDLGEEARAEFLRQTDELAQKAALVLIDLGQPAVENLAITDLRAADAVIATGRDTRFEARMQVFGPQLHDGKMPPKGGTTNGSEKMPPEGGTTNGNRQRVELLVDGRRIGETEATLSADGMATAAFSYRFDAPGDHAVEARAPGDALDIDNHRYLVASARASIRVLCIDGRPSGGTLGGAADYLSLALAPREKNGGPATIQAEVAPESAILERGLSAYDCIFLCNVAQFTASEVRALDAYLQGGGSVVIFLGDQVRADRYNQELGRAGQGGAGQGRAGQGRAVPILPAAIGQLDDRPQFRLDPLGCRHPILEAFRGRGLNSLLTTPVFKHYRLEIPRDSTAQTILKLGDGDPLMVEQQVHRGRVVLVATSVETSWTALPLWPSFVPLVQELTLWCAAGQSACKNVTVGDSLDCLLASPAGTPGIQMPDGRRRSVQTRSVGDGTELNYADTWQSGIYAVQTGQPAGRGQLFAVNVDTVESDLAAIGPEEFQTDVWPGIPFLHQTTWQDLDATAVAVGAARGRNRLHVNLLYAVFGLLLFETFWGWKMGRE